MNETVKNTGLFAIVAVLIVLTGVTQSWNAALLIIAMGLISSIMAVSYTHLTLPTTPYV